VLSVATTARFGLLLLLGAAIDPPVGQPEIVAARSPHVIRRHGSSHDHHIPALADLSDQVARTIRHSPAQYLYSALPSLKAWKGLLEANP
jgi:hypothetical protein